MSTRRLSLNAIDLCMLLFALSAILGVIPAYDPSLSLSTVVAILGSIGLYFAIAYLPRSRNAVLLVAGLILFVAFGFGLLFITQYGYLNINKGGIISRIGQITTVQPNLSRFVPFPNALETFLEVSVPLGIGLFLSSRRTAPRIVVAVGILVTLYAIFLTASRSSWLALAATAGLAVLLTILARLPRHLVAATIGVSLAVIAALLLVVIVLGPDRLPFLASTFSRASDRGQLYWNSLYLAGDYAFTGAGMGNTFAMIYSRYGLLIQVPYLTYAHNLPLSIWLNQGLLGLIAFGGVLVAFYLYVFRVGRSVQPSAIFYGAWLAASTTLLHGLTDAPQYAAGNHWLMPISFIAIGLTVAAGQLAIRTATQPVKTHSIPRLVAIGVPVALVVVVIIFGRQLRAAWSTNLGAIAEARAELSPGLSDIQRAEGFDQAQALYQEALSIEPAWPNANRRSGNLAVKLGQYDAAVSKLETAFSREAGNPAAVKGLGLAYTWVGRTADAARTFLLVDDPENMAQELFTWANYRMEQKQPLLAAYAMEAALTMYPDSTNLNVWLLLADTYRAADRVETARVWYNRILTVDPANAGASSALAELGN